MSELGVVIPAAGQGKRMEAGCNKQFLILQGRPVLAHTVSLFEESEYVSEIVIAGAVSDLSRLEDMVSEYGFTKVTAIVRGGTERQDSVYAGIQALSSAVGRVVVHDGARPLLSLREFHRFLGETEGFAAAVMGIPLQDTVKRIDDAGKVLETLPREVLRAIQTPQIFERSLLEEAHRRSAAEGYYGTDDAILLERLGYSVRIAAGSAENIKITLPEDLWLAEQILARRTG